MQLWISEEAQEEPFSSAEEAWFWYCQCQEKRDLGLKRTPKTITERPCDPDDIYCALVRLVLANKLTQKHVKTLKDFGQQFRPPYAYIPQEREHAKRWQEAMGKLEETLKKKKIIR